MKYFFSFLAVLFLSFGLLAQTTGIIQGTVVDNNKEPLPGATLEISSPALQGTRVTTSDVNGFFIFRALPPGMYKLKATMQGFGPLEQTDIQVFLDKTITLTIQMQPAFEEIITITGESPLIDITDTTTGANITQELIKDLPAGRTYQSLAMLAGTAVPGGLGDNPSFMGASAAENRYIIDGIDTTDAAFGTTGTNVTYNFVQEVEIKTGGYEAEYGGALGGVVNVITKQGSNEFHGDVFGYYTDDDFTAEGEEPESMRASRVVAFSNYDFGVDIGGKIIQDKLWYFLAINPVHYEQDIEVDTPLGVFSASPAMDGQYYAGKLNYMINPSNTLVASIIADPRERDNEYYTAFVAPESATGVETNMFYKDYKEGGWNWSGTWSSILSPAMLFELKYAHHETTEEYVPVLNAPHYEDGTRNGRWSGGIGNRVRFGGPGFMQPQNDRSRDQIKASLNYYIAGHELKAGIQYFSLEYNDIAHVAGPSDQICVPLAEGAYMWDWTIGDYVELEPNCDTNGDGINDGYLIGPLPGNRYRLRNWGYYNSNYKNFSTGKTKEWAVFLQDSWKITPYFTLNVGVRMDATKIEGDMSNLIENREIEFGLTDQIAPRIGFVWDFAKNQRSKIYGHYGRFYESIPMDINVRAFGNERYDFYYYYYPENGQLPSPDNPGTLFYISHAGGGTMADPNLEGQYTEEVVLGGEYEIMPNLAIGLKGIYRSLGQVIEDISVTAGHTYYITNPGGCTNTDPVTGYPIDPDDPSYTVCFPRPVRYYRGVELSLNKRFANNWQLYASLLWSKNEGNYGGLFRQDNGQLDPNITSLYDLPELLYLARGLLPNDREWQFKSYGSYRFNFGLVTGFAFNWMTGTPISKLGAHPTYGPRERFVTKRGSEGRTPDIWSLDIHLEYPVKFGNFAFSIIGDLFNVTNNQKAIYVDQEWSYLEKWYTDDPAEANESPETNPYWDYINQNWGKSTVLQDPFSFRLGLKLSW